MRFPLEGLETCDIRDLPFGRFRYSQGSVTDNLVLVPYRDSPEPVYVIIRQAP